MNSDRTIKQILTVTQEGIVDTPSLVFTEMDLAKNFQAFKSGMQALENRSKIFFPIKACYEPEVIRTLDAMGIDGFEVMSAHELRHIRQALGRYPSLIMTGNGRTEDDLKIASTSGAIIVIDSISDATLISNFAQKIDHPFKILLRLIFPDESLSSDEMGYKNPSCKVGVVPFSAEFFRILEILLANPLLQVVGLHCHQQIQQTDSVVYLENLSKIKETIPFIESSFGRELELIDIGGGFEHLSSEKIEHLMKMISFEFQNLFPEKKLIIEPGRAMVGSAGYVVTRVIDVKTKQGVTNIFVDAGTNLLVPTSSKRYKLHYPEPSSEGLRVNIVDGVLSPSNIIVEQQNLSELPKLGSLMLLGNCGAYTTVLEHQWLRPLHPVFFFEKSGKIKNIFTRRQAFEMWRLRYGTDISPSEG